MSEAKATEDKLLDRLAYAMMACEVTRRPTKSIDDLMNTEREIQRTYRRFISSREAHQLL